MDLAVHILDFRVHCFGPIEAASGQAANHGGLYAVEDTVVASWRHANGVQGSGEWCFVATDDLDQVEITGTKGRIVFECFADTPVRLLSLAGNQEAALPNPPHVQQPFIQSIVDELTGRGHCPGDTAQAAGLQAATDSILAAYYGRA